MATSLRDTIRAMTAVGASVVPNLLVDEALARHRRLEEYRPVEWVASIGSTGLREYRAAQVCAWGAVEPCTEATAAAAGQKLQQTTGAAVASWTIDERGLITYPSDQSAQGSHYWSGYSFDLCAAAADVLEQSLVVTIGDVAFQDGDQKFDPATARAAVVEQVANLRRRALPRVVRRVKSDDAPELRRFPRSRGGNDR